MSEIFRRSNRYRQAGERARLSGRKRRRCGRKRRPKEWRDMARGERRDTVACGVRLWYVNATL